MMNVPLYSRSALRILGLIGGIVLGSLLVIFAILLLFQSSQAIQMLIAFPFVIIGVGILVNSVASLTGYLSGSIFRLFTRKPHID